VVGLDMDGPSVEVTRDPDHNAASVPGRWKRRRYDTNKLTWLGTTMPFWRRLLRRDFRRSGTSFGAAALCDDPQRRPCRHSVGQHAGRLAVPPVGVASLPPSTDRRRRVVGPRRDGETCETRLGQPSKGEPDSSARLGRRESRGLGHDTRSTPYVAALREPKRSTLDRCRQLAVWFRLRGAAARSRADRSGGRVAG
jgi:hypothetical protein